MSISITQIQYILALSEELHFGRAAERCHVSQPSLSAQVQKAEEALDIIIFDRSMKPIRVTDIGVQLIEEMKRTMKSYRAIEALAQCSGDELMGSFRLAVIPTVAQYLIPYFATQFAEQYPRVELEIEEMETEAIIDALLKDEIDAGLLATPLHTDQIIERRLYDEPFYAYLNRSDALADHEKLTVEDLSERMPWVLKSGHCFGNQTMNLCRRAGHPLKHGQLQFRSGNIETLMRLVDRGSGFTLVPMLSVLDLISSQDESSASASLAKAFQSPAPAREISLVHSRSFLKENILDALTESIRDGLPASLKRLQGDQYDIIGIYEHT